MSVVHGRSRTLSKNLTAALVLFVLASATGPAAEVSGPEARARFNVLDADGDGVVKRSEYEMHKVDALFGRDRNADGRLGPDETRASPEAFDRLDADGDGQLSGTELVLSRELQFDHIDRDGDGALTLEELDALLTGFTQ